MQESTLTIKGQTTLPKAVRAALNLNPGDRIRYLVLDNGEVRILGARPAASLAGILRHDGAPVSLQRMEEAIAAGGADDDGRA